MNGEIIKRLRDQWEATPPDICYAAADRIEALETALREKDNIAYISDGHGITHNTFTIVYRAALGDNLK